MLAVILQGSYHACPFCGEAVFAMSQQATPVTMAEPVRPVGLALRHWWRVYCDLSKARLSMLVVITTAVGFVLASGSTIDWLMLLWTVLGTTMAAASANTMNQVMEIERDRRMRRTQSRPLPSGRVGVVHAATFGVLIGGLGVTLLAVAVNTLTAALALLTILLYLVVYTPMKPRTTLNTLVGAVVGAIPPMMGWTGATGGVELGAWLLFATLFAWQIPHFLALAWMYREDYERGGYRMLPIIDPSGRITCRAVVMWCLALLPITLALSAVGVTGVFFAVGAVALGAWLLKLGVELNRRCNEQHARKVFLASVLYLPLLMGLMLLDRGPNAHRPSLTTTPTATVTAPVSVAVPVSTFLPGEADTTPSVAPVDYPTAAQASTDHPGS
ncbi:MAG: protoheme IX farnesyltransferase [Phycisphaera sp.]|nr:protoheme IX farnesyltransferase [Phycisphaera sp.]